MNEKRPVTEPTPLGKAFNIALKVVMFPATVVTGWFTGDVFIRNSVYKNFVKHGYFDGRLPRRDGIQGEYSKQFRQVVAEKYAYKIENAASSEVRDHFVKNAAKFHVFDDLPELQSKFHIPSSPATLETIETAAGKTLEAANAGGRISKLIGSYRSTVGEFFKDIDMLGMKGYLKGTTRNQKVEAAVFAITSAGITLGALLSLNSRSAQEKIDRLVERSDNGEQKSR